MSETEMHVIRRQFFEGARVTRSLSQEDLDYLRRFTEAISPGDIRGWLQERLENCMRHAADRTGADRRGWLEDAAFFSVAVEIALDAEGCDRR